MGGGLGLGPVASTVRALARSAAAVTPVVIVGKNRALQRRVSEAARRDGTDVRVLGFVHDVHDWMHAADVLVTKPGGLTTSEALAAGTPLVLLRPLPGQEERNAKYLVSHGAALRASRGSELVRLVDAVLAGGEPARRLRAAAAALAPSGRRRARRGARRGPGRSRGRAFEPLSPTRRGGRAAEGGGLLNRYTHNSVSRVRIPPSPKPRRRGIALDAPYPRRSPASGAHMRS